MTLEVGREEDALVADMKHELRWGFPNNVGADLVAIMQVYDDYVEMAILHGTVPEREESLNVAVGSLVEIDGAPWRLVSVHRRSPVPEGSPPGTGAGQLAAVIERATLPAESE